MHSEDDNVVSIIDSDRLVETLRAEGSVDVQYSRFEKSPQPAAKGRAGRLSILYC